jgi:hypothetical protein
MAKIVQILKSIRTVQVLFYINAATWVILGIVSLIRLSKGSSVGLFTAIIIAVLMFGNAAAMLISGLGLGKPLKRCFYFALAVLIVNIVLSVTDEVGVWDLITLLLDLILFGLLVGIRKRYFQRSTSD